MHLTRSQAKPNGMLYNIVPSNRMHHSTVLIYLTWSQAKPNSMLYSTIPSDGMLHSTHAYLSNLESGEAQWDAL